MIRMEETEKKLDVKIPKWAKDLAAEEDKLGKSINKKFLNISGILPDFSKMLPDFSKIVPKVEVPLILPPAKTEAKLMGVPRFFRDSKSEENNWERHTELMKIQDGILKVNESILLEQASTSKLTKWILVFTLLALFISIVGLTVSL